MGIALSRLLHSFFGKREARVVMVGLDAAGKTTILHAIAYGETIETVPTIGFTLQSVRRGKLDLNVWDIGGQSEFRSMWKHYYKGSDALIYVVDAADHTASRKQEARDALEAALETDDLKGVPVLVLANKQDISGAMPGTEVRAMLGLELVKGREVEVVETVGINGKGLEEGIKWLCSAMDRHWKSTGTRK